MEASIYGGEEGAGEWDVLHKARSDKNLKNPENGQVRKLCNAIKVLWDRMSDKEALELPLLFAERHLRHTWDIQGADKFYRFFRLTSASEINIDNRQDYGLDAVGFELFGDIHEM